MDLAARAAARLHGADFEEFVARFYEACITLGTADRAGLRGRGFTDPEVDLGTTELLARGFLVRTDDEDTWDVVPPRESIPQYLDAVEHRAALTRAAVSELDNQWRRAVGRGTLAALPDLDVLSSVPEAVERIVQMHRTARHRLWWALDPSVATRELLARAAQDHAVLELAPGVEMRMVLDTSLLEEPWAMDRLQHADAQGHATRVANGIPFGVVICDDESVLVEISSHDPEGYGSLALRREPARRAVIQLFERIWSLATPYGPTRRKLAASGEEPVAPLDDRDTRVLALLAVGASDKVIARQIGVSVRTVERRVRYLMEHLSVATRFQAGVQAARRGWV